MRTKISYQGVVFLHELKGRKRFKWIAIGQPRGEIGRRIAKQLEHFPPKKTPRQSRVRQFVWECVENGTREKRRIEAVTLLYYMFVRGTKKPISNCQLIIHPVPFPDPTVDPLIGPNYSGLRCAGKKGAI